MVRLSGFTLLAALTVSAGPADVSASARTGAVVVAVSGVRGDTGEVACALFSAAAGFPLDTSGARVLRQRSRPGGVECRFDGLLPGTYAVAAFHDLDGDLEVDRTVLGVPREAWGVSDDVRPRLRAPRFREAAFVLAGGETRRVAVRVAR